MTSWPPFWSEKTVALSQPQFGCDFPKIWHFGVPAQITRFGIIIQCTVSSTYHQNDGWKKNVKTVNDENSKTKRRFWLIWTCWTWIPGVQKKTLPKEHARNRPISKIETWKFSTVQPDSVKLLCKVSARYLLSNGFYDGSFRELVLGGESKKTSWNDALIEHYLLGILEPNFCHDYIEQLNYVTQVC